MVSPLNSAAPGPWEAVWKELPAEAVNPGMHPKVGEQHVLWGWEERVWLQRLRSWPGHD